jgi:hypothetical protein
MASKVGSADQYVFTHMHAVALNWIKFVINSGTYSGIVRPWPEARCCFEPVFFAGLEASAGKAREHG